MNHRIRTRRGVPAAHSQKIEHPPLRYFGGKWLLARDIIALFPPHVCYVEPYCGGASVLLQKPPSRHEVMNDLDQDVIAFFDVLRQSPRRLIRELELTPYSRAELSRARKKETDLTDLERARRLFVRCWQSFSSGNGTGWRYQIGNMTDTRADVIQGFKEVDRLWAVARRLRNVQIECDDALKVITRYDAKTTLFYIDPPYVHSTRYRNSKDKGYTFEMSDEHHRDLAAVLNQAKGMIILSGYRSDLYDDLFGHWQRIDRVARNIYGTKMESLWVNPAATALNHLPLFREAGAE